MSHAVTNQSLDADRSSFSRTSLGDSNSPVTLHEAIEGGAPAPSARVEIEDFWRNSLKGADGQERLIMLLYYRDGMTMRAIGEQVGVSESRVSQIHSGVLQRMKNLLEQQRTHTRLTTAMESEITEMLKSSDPREHLIRRVQAVCNRRGCRRGRPLGRASVEKVISRLFDALVEA